MAIPTFKAKLSQKEVINEHFFELHIELLEPNRIKFTAGQYILMTLPDHPQRKQYSIASAPSMDHAVELLVDSSPGGIGSQYLSKLKPGDTVEFMAPMGGFTVDTQQDESELVFIGTGSGITPLRSMILDQLINKQDPRPIKLFWGMRYAQDLFWEEEFHQLDKEHDNFRFELILSKPPDNWKLSRGYVTDLLEGYQDNFSDAGFYICGSTKMVEDVKAYLYDKGADDAYVHREKFY